MGRKARMALGGALAGLGEGLIQRSSDRVKEEQRKRDELLTLLRDKNAREFRSSQIINTDFDADSGRAVGITSGGDVKSLDYTPLPSRQPGALTDLQRYKAAVDQATTDTGLDGKTIDYVKARQILEATPESAHLARLIPSGAGHESIDRSSDLWLQAEQYAKGVSKDMERLLTFDKTIFEPFGGRTKFEDETASDWYKEQKGGGPAKSVAPAAETTLPGTKPTADTQKASTQTGLLPPESSVESSIRELMAEGRSMAEANGITATAGSGAGTQTDPHKPTTQEDFDRIKAGEYFIDPSDGQLYTK